MTHPVRQQNLNSHNESPFSYLDHKSSKDIFTTKSNPHEMKFYVEGVQCNRCLSKIEKESKNFPGLETLNFDMSRNILTAQLSEGSSFATLAQKVTNLGFKVMPLKNNDSAIDNQKKTERTLLIQMAVAGACTGNIMLYTVSLYSGAQGEVGRAFEWITFVFFLPVLFYSALPFYKTTWNALKNKSSSIDLPIVFALIVGSALSLYHLIIGHGDIYFDSLAALIFLLLAARFTLKQIQQRYLTTSYLKTFLSGETTRLWDEKTQSSTLVSTESLKPGDLILIQQNEKLPADGVQHSEDPIYLNNSILTGESYPHKSFKDQKCFAGTQLLSPSLLLKVNLLGSETRMGQIISKMEQELQTKTPLINLTDKIANYFVTTVILLGSIFFLYYFTINLEEAIRRSLALVILACPCALALATPLTHSLSLAKAAKNGIFIKNANVLEKINTIKNMAFDKTGTLTLGKFQLLQWLYAEPSKEYQSIILELEKHSEHPIAQAFKNSLSSKTPLVSKIIDYKETIGQGVSGTYNNHHYELKAFKDYKLKDVGTAVGLYKDQKMINVAIFGDQIHKSTAATIRSLQNKNINVFLLSGDSQNSVQTIAEKMDLKPSQTIAEMSPESKYQWIAKHPQTMMIGDGANDSLAMAKSTCSVAAQGSMESSLKACDIYLNQSGISSIYKLHILSKETFKIIKRNLSISLIYNVVAGTAALLGYVNPLVAAILMPISSLTVLLSSLWGTHRLRKFQQLGEEIS